jgi:hypothetical protein
VETMLSTVHDSTTVSIATPMSTTIALWRHSGSRDTHSARCDLAQPNADSCT